MKTETTYSAILGKILARKRKERGWDQAEIAQKTGINRSSWSRLENGETAPDAIQLAKIADAFGMKSKELFAEVDDVKVQLEKQDIQVHMAKAIPQRDNNKLGIFLLGTALGAIIAALMSGNTPKGK